MPLSIDDWNGHLALHDVEEKPKKPLKVSFGNVCIEKLGQVLTPKQVNKMPCIQWDGMNRNALHTFVATDPDVPSREDPSMGEWHHCIVVNMKGNDFESGKTLTKFVGSAPGKDTGLHRYTLLVYEQSGPLTCDEPILGDKSAEHREKFKAKKFRHKYKLGPPVAGMCYQAEWDESVPALYEQMGVKQ
ncbi:phosphatidylethanolamine-binding protein 1-like [Hyperolius riggenbachi]|uniref:phosphatidylethanolamine-binding protein 1-like n=1 Tax=Hyperolius riggenbachi TaxID=752182 RepID=UPI0035A363BE